MPPDELLETYALSAVGYGFVFLIGLLFGSFANVCIYRWPPTDEHPKGRSVVKPGSHCSACGKPVRWYDNVPILSWLWLRGKCRDCGTEFSARYLLVEAATGMLFVAAYHLVVGMPMEWDPLSVRMLRFLIYAALLFTLVVITFIDLDHKLILDRLTYPAIPIFYGLGLLLPENHWLDGLIGAAVGYGIVRAISDGYYFLTKREGLGYGDGKLLALVGALLGWEAVVFALFGGSVLGSVIGITALLLVRRKGDDESVPEEGDTPLREGAGEGDVGDGLGAEDDEEVSLRHVELPFGPFLAMAAIVYLFAQPWLRIHFAGFASGGVM